MGTQSGLAVGAQKADEPTGLVAARGLAWRTHSGYLLFLASSFLYFCTGFSLKLKSLSLAGSLEAADKGEGVVGCIGV